MSILLLFAQELADRTVELPMVYSRSTGVLLDENGIPILDELGGLILTGDVGIFEPGVRINVTVVLPLVTSAPTIFDPTITQPAQVTVEMNLVTVTPTVYEPTISIIGTQTIGTPLVTSPQLLFPPDVSITGIQTVELPFITVTFDVFAPRVVQQQTVELPFVTVTFDVPNIRVHRVPRPHIFRPPHDDHGPRKLSEYGRVRAGVSKMANDLAGRYGAPRSFSVLKINGVYVTIQGPTMDQVNASTEYYAGGHDHLIEDDTIAAALEAAGFDVEGFPEG